MEQNNGFRQVSNFAQRLKEYIDTHKGITYEELSKQTGAPAQTLNRYVLGQRVPKIDAATDIALKLHVSPLWLQGFDVDMYMPSNIFPIHKTKRAPLIGQIACGTPILAEENVEDYIPYPDIISADFCLRCKGDSMTGAGIYDGDIVFIRQQSDVDDGEIAAVRVGQGEGCEATLKRVYHGHHKLTLVAENPGYKNQVYEKERLDEVEIIGKAVWYLSRVK